MQHSFGIIGLGVMGTAAAWQLAKAGADVIGFDRFPAGHDQGSSHGRTRIIRSVYYEGGVYNPLLERAYAHWADMGATAGRTFFHPTGGLDISLKPAGAFEQALAAAQAGSAEYEVLEGRAIEARFPALDLGGRARAVYAPGSGLIDSDDAHAWLLDEAQRLGAQLNLACAFSGWQRTRTGFRLETGVGPVRVDRLIIAAGAWLPQLVPALAKTIIPERQVVAWYPSTSPDLDALPIFQLEDQAGERFYAFPPHKGEGLKFGLYHHRRERGAGHIAARGVERDDLALLERGLDLCLPGLQRTPQNAMECRFTLAPDNRFVIGPMPDDRDLIIASPCSGHGFKFAPAIGEMVAQLALEQDLTVDASAFGVERVV